VLERDKISKIKACSLPISAVVKVEKEEKEIRGKVSEGSIDLIDGYAQPLSSPTSVGTGIIRDEAVKLSQLIDVINERFGTDFNQADQLFFDQIIETAANLEELQQAAQVNSADKFALLFNRILETIFVERMDENETIFARYMNDPAFQKAVSEWIESPYSTITWSSDQPKN
jgi:type I restriction enzyme R subunit